MRYRVLPYKQGSKSAKALAEALGGKVLKLQDSTFSRRPGDVVVEWGNKAAANKLAFFRRMVEAGHEALIPKFWTSSADIPDEAFPVMCRTTLTGHSGAGIVLSKSRAELVPAPLYVRYVRKNEEYRVHVGKKGQETSVIAVQRKARRLSVPDGSVNWKVRNLAGGFVYTREGFTAPAAVLDAARHALGASGVDFGAVDVLWSSKQERAIVLEINTAPGLEGQTVQDYAAFFYSAN